MGTSSFRCALPWASAQPTHDALLVGDEELFRAALDDLVDRHRFSYEAVMLRSSIPPRPDRLDALRALLDGLAGARVLSIEPRR